jgi:peptide/nickel transport system substrate-binding protein
MVLISLFVVALATTGCDDGTVTTTTAGASTETTVAGTETTAGSTETTVSAETPVTGGTMRVLLSEFPTVMGNPKNWSAPKSTMSACLEQLATYDLDGNLVPVLATSWDVDATAKTITFHLREGVKFHDGTDWDAEAAKWNYDLWIASKKLAGSDLITSTEAVDKYTFRLNLSQCSAMYVPTYAQYPYFFSPTYVEQVGLEASDLHPVGTGPFKFESYEAGSSMKYVKFEDYWQEGLPYLDAYEFSQTSDKTSANMMLQSGQADIMVAVAPKDVADLKAKGFGIFYNPGFIYNLWPNSADASDPLSNAKVREAVEYAIDRAAIAEKMGYGLSETMDAFVPKSTAIYPEGYTPRTYDPAKAKQLLTEAGYPDGFQTSIIVRNDDTHRDVATAIQGYLAEVGVKLDIDVADTARYNSYQQKGATFKGFYMAQTRKEPGVAFVQGIVRDVRPGGICPNTTRSAEFTAIYEKLVAATDEATLLSAGKELAKQGSIEVMTIPICTMPNVIAYGEKVHTTYMMAGGNFNVFSDWIEK